MVDGGIGCSTNDLNACWLDQLGILAEVIRRRIMGSDTKTKGAIHPSSDICHIELVLHSSLRIKDNSAGPSISMAAATVIVIGSIDKATQCISIVDVALRPHAGVI